MLTEAYMLQKRWVDALVLITELIGAYELYPECQDEVAEAYCHLAHIAVETDDRATAYMAADRAIQIGESLKRPVWGDPSVDVVWKAYAWKNVAYHKFQESAELKAALQAELNATFIENPALIKCHTIEVEI